MKKTFVCPRCDKEIDIKDGIIRAIEISSEKDNRYGYDPYYFRIVTKYYNVRFCKSCSHQLTKYHYLRHVLWFILPQFICLIIGICLGEIPWGIMAIIFTVSVLTYVLAVVIYRNFKSRFYAKKIMEKAKRCGAMA